MINRMQWSLHQLAAATAGRPVAPVGGAGEWQDTEVTSVTIDSRTARPQSLFVPIVAARDGHAFLQDAIDILVRVVTAETESHGAVHGRERNLHCPQYVRRFERARRAGRPARSANPEIAKLIEHPFAFDIMARKVQRVWQSRRL